MRSFNLKYPNQAYSDEDRKEIFVGFVEGEEKLHYRILSSRVKNATLEDVMKAVKHRLRLEIQEERGHAPRKLPLLSKGQNQSVVGFCLELDILSLKPHPECDEDTLGLKGSVQA